jgi:phenylalanyl-tRNA synthetase beta chain
MMKTVLSWLAESVDLPASIAEVEAALNRSGLTVEATESRGADIAEVVVAQIKSSVPHPNADRLSVCQVDDGSGAPRQIVCGAKNYKVGDKVPLALPGAVLPGDFKIKVGKLRGVESAGMLCSAKELRIAGDAQGLLILDMACEVGKPIGLVFPCETVMELEVTPNRPDCLGHVGVAREIAAFTGAAFHPPLPSAPAHAPGDIVRVEDFAICPFYSACRISGVRVGPSPEWMRRRLEAVGLRPINSIVDITNYVMLETGQPLHAFDAAKVPGPITVRTAHGGEAFAALDGKTHTLPAQAPVIASGKKILALAGIMGGEESGVTEATTDIILESAVFAPALIRSTARALGLHSDSSYRFERGVSAHGVLPASARAAALISEHAGGVAGSWISSGTLPSGPAPVAMREERCRHVLGCEISNEAIASALARLDIHPAGAGLWSIPCHRLDLTREVDLIEEVARTHGIENIPSRLAGGAAPASAADAFYDFTAMLRSTLVALGFCEARTGTLISRSAASDSMVSERAWQILRNPLGEDQAILRPSLLPGLLQSLTKNLHAGVPFVRLFEVGRVFRSENPEERTHLALVLTGPCAPITWDNPQPRPMDFFDLKAVLTKLLPIEAQAAVEASPLAVRSLLTVNDIPLGHAGQLAPARARTMDARHPVFAAEIELRPADTNPLQYARHSAIPIFPATARDVAIICPSELPYARIAAEIHSAKEPLLAGFFAFDLFRDPEGKHLPTNKKSLAICLTFRSPERTLETSEINSATDRIKARLNAELGVDFRE